MRKQDNIVLSNANADCGTALWLTLRRGLSCNAHASICTPSLILTPAQDSRSAAHPLQLCNIMPGAGMALDMAQVVPALERLPAQDVQHQELGVANCG